MHSGSLRWFAKPALNFASMPIIPDLWLRFSNISPSLLFRDRQTDGTDTGILYPSKSDIGLGGRVSQPLNTVEQRFFRASIL